MKTAYYGYRPGVYGGPQAAELPGPVDLIRKPVVDLDYVQNLRGWSRGYLEFAISCKHIKVVQGRQEFWVYGKSIQSANRQRRFGVGLQVDGDSFHEL